MRIDIGYHEMLLLIIENLQNDMMKIEDPFGKDRILYQNHIYLMSKAMDLLYKTFRDNNQNKMQDNLSIINNQLNLINNQYVN